MSERPEAMPGPIDANAELKVSLVITHLVDVSHPQDANDIERVVTEVSNQIRGDIDMQEQIGETAWNQIDRDLGERIRGQARFFLERHNSSAS